MHEDYTIRSAVPSDLAALVDIEAQAVTMFAEFGLAEVFANLPTPLSDFEEGCAQERLWVAVTKDDQPVGFALACVVGDCGHLDELDVHPDHGRRGLGKALVGRFCEWAEASGFGAVTLTTMRQVSWNAPFYERLGFRELRADEMSPALAAQLRAEIARGCPSDGHIAMYKSLSTIPTQDRATSSKPPG